MKTTYFNKKSELTQQLDLYAAQGLRTYRTRTTCGCAENNLRKAVLVVNPTDDKHMFTFIRCLSCAKKGGAPW